MHGPPKHEQTTRGDPASEHPYRDPAPRPTQLNHNRHDERGEDEEHRCKAKQGLGAYIGLAHAGSVHESVNKPQ